MGKDSALGCSAWALTVGLALSGCATPQASTASVDPSAEVSTPQDPLVLSRRVYELGEAAWAGGAKFEAVALWRQAFRSLPAEEKYDVLRHRMVVRIGYALVELHRIDGDLYHLQAAQQMVSRWIDARAERDSSGAREEAYALLGEIELRLESPATRSTGDEEYEQGEAARAQMLAGYEGKQAEYREAESHAGEILDADGIHRTVEVSRLSTLDDPRVRAFLRHPSPEGPSLFDLPGEALNPTRPLVRAGLPRIAAKGAANRRAANRATWRIIRELRPALELCYASSMARAPTQFVRMRVALSVAEDGEVEAKRSSGDPLGDTIGDDCVRRTFERVHVEEAGLRGERLAVVPLLFFIQPGQGLAPSLQGLPGWDASMADREGSYQSERQTETSNGVGSGQRGN